MGKLAGLALVLVAYSVTTSANATVFIQSDSGGRIDDYLSHYRSVRASNERVVIDGTCLSACTLVLGMLPRGRVCVTDRATLGFHAAWEPDQNGRPVNSPKWTQVVLSNLPGSIRHWISRHGGLRPEMLYLRGRELAQLVSLCEV